MRTALTIAGSDSSGGAGIQADIKTMTMNGVFAMSAITSFIASVSLGIRHTPFLTFFTTVFAIRFRTANK